MQRIRNCYEWKIALIKISECYKEMELSGCDDFTLKALFSCFRGDSSKRNFFKTMMSQYQKRYVWTDKFWKPRKQKKLSHFQKKIDTCGLVLIVWSTWTQTRDNLFHCTYCSASNWMCMDNREWAKLLGLQGWTVPGFSLIFDTWLTNTTSLL